MTAPPRHRDTALPATILLVATLALPATSQDAPGSREFRVNTSTEDYQVDPEVAADAAGNFVVVWTSLFRGDVGDGTPYTVIDGIFGQRFDSVGRAVGGEFKLSSETLRYPVSDVAMDAAGNFVVVWNDPYVGLKVRRYDSAGVAQEEEVRLVERRTAASPVVTSDAAGNWRVVWEGYPPGSLNPISSRRFDAATRVWLEEIPISETGGSYPAVASRENGDFVVVWSGRQAGDLPRGSVMGRRFTSTGDPLAGEFQVDQTGGASRAAVTLDEEGEFVVAWRRVRSDDVALLARRFDASGTPLHDEVEISSANAFPRLAVTAPGETLVAWISDSARFGGERLFQGRLIDRFGNLLGEAFPLSRFEVSPFFGADLLRSTPAGGDRLIAAFPVGDDLYARLLPSRGLLVFVDDPELPFSDLGESDGTVTVGVLRVGGTAGRVSAEYFTAETDDGGARAGEDFVAAAGVVVFEPGETLRTFQLEILDDGQRESTESFLVGLANPTGGAAVDEPSTAAITVYDNDSVRPGEGPLALGREIAVNSYLSGEQRHPRVAAAPGGEFLVVWQSLDQDVDGWSVLARLFDARGGPRGGELRLSDATAEGQFRPSVAATPGGDFVVVWSTRSELRGRRVVATDGGEPRLEEELGLGVCSRCDSTFSQEIAVDGEESFVVAWSNQYFSASTFPPNLFTQRFSREGERLSERYDVYSYGQGSGIASRPGEEYLVVWNHAIRPGISFLSGQPFDALATPVPEGEIAIDAELFGNQEAHPGVAYQGEDRWLAVWQRGVDPDAPTATSLLSRAGRDVYARRLRSDGEALSDIFRLAAFLPGEQTEPRVAAAPSGDAVVVWTSEGEIAPGRRDVFARRLAADGRVLGERFPVNPSPRRQSAPAVASDTAGDFVVVWEEEVGDGDTDIFAQRFSGSSCVPGQRTLCLRQGRFALEVEWKDFRGVTGNGRAVALTEDTGAFFFFDPDNVELVVKVLDGRLLTGHFWVFYGALSNTEFSLRVTDTETGAAKTYSNPLGMFASVGDVEALPGANSALTPARLAPVPAKGPNGGGCTAGATRLCLGGGRFRVEVEWEDFEGQSGVGTAVPLTDDTGLFWFFDEANLEVAVKVLDGRALTGHFWVFYGSLSNVGFVLTVSDTVTGESRRYVNPRGSFASVGDVEALPAPSNRGS